MEYASLNFILDVTLILISLTFLMREYPARTAVLTVMCVLSYLIPLTAVEDFIDPSLEKEVPVVDNVAPQNPPDPNDPTQQAAQLTQANPAQSMNNVMNLWNSVLNNLPTMSGGPGGQVDIQKSVQERSGAQSFLPASKPTPSFSFPAFREKFLSHRLGHAMRPHDVLLVEEFWFFARCFLLAGASYFIFSDWKITLSIISMGVIPIHYYLLLFLFISQNVEKTRRWWGDIGVFFLVLMILILGLNFIRFFLKQKHSNDFQIPNPADYKARLNGTDYDYEVWPDHLKVADIKLDLGLSYLDPKNPSLLRFTSGAAIQFVPRNTSK